MSKGLSMFEDEVLLSFLDASANQALERLKREQLLSVEQAMPLLLKAQFNHIAHLDQSIDEMKSRFATMDLRFDAIDARFDTIDTRFATIDIRFAVIESRLDKIDERFARIDERFERIDERFEKIDERFEKIDERFEKIDEKFERLFHRMNAQIAWTVGTILASSGMIFGLNRLFA